jgi:hypothetical protein
MREQIKFERAKSNNITKNKAQLKSENSKPISRPNSGGG